MVAGVQVEGLFQDTCGAPEGTQDPGFEAGGLDRNW